MLLCYVRARAATRSSRSDVDEPKDHEVLVRYAASGLCHSDVHFLTGDHAGPLPFCGGHEGAGVIEAVGPGVSSLKAGDHVVASFIPSCGRCRYCASGRMNLCQLGAHLQVGPMPDGTYRMHLDGADLHQFLLISTFSQYAVVSENSLVKVASDLPLDTICLLGCGVGTGFGSATNSADVRPGDVVMVVGVGGVGTSAVQGAALAGAAAVVAVDPVPFKREMAEKLGATATFETMAEATDFVRSITDGQGADSAILTHGLADQRRCRRGVRGDRQGRHRRRHGHGRDRRTGGHSGASARARRHAEDHQGLAFRHVQPAVGHPAPDRPLPRRQAPAR